MKRTLMLKNRELLDFEVDLATDEIRVLDGPEAGDALLFSLGFGDGSDRDAFVADIVRGRCLSPNREDLEQILAAFGARSSLELVFRGHGLSLIDRLWYRAPGATERWEDINFFDNEWDDAYRSFVLTRDCKGLASCSPDVPDVTTGGHLRKAWERTEEGIHLLKEPLFKSGNDLEGALLGAELCRLFFGQDAFQPLNIVERFGARLAASPLMLGRDEELVQRSRLFAMGGFSLSEAEALLGFASPRSLVDAMSRVGVADASEHVAKMFAFKALALLADIHSGNFGVIRNAETGACRAAPPFDYDRAFGFPYEGFPLEAICSDPTFALFLCAKEFSDLEPSWDWEWYDPQVLDGFEDRIVQAYASFSDLPPNFGRIVAQFFVMQRDYLNKTASVRMSP